MGCWDATCCLSGLSISYGKEVYIWLIAPSGNGNDSGISGNFYPADTYHPISFMLRGVYNDYGGMENVEEGYSSKHVISMLKEGVLNLKQDSEYTKLPDDYSDIEIDEVIHYVERGYVWYNNRKVDMFIVRKDVVDANVKSYLDLMLTRFGDLYEAIDNFTPVEEGDDVVSTMKRDLYKYTNLFFRSIDNINHAFLIDGIYKDLLIRSASSYTFSDADKDSLVYTVAMDAMLSHLRKNWTIQQSGVGSQHFNHRQVRDFYKSVLEICERSLRGM